MKPVQGAARRHRHAARSAFAAGCSAARWKRCRSAWSGPTTMPASSPTILREHPKVEAIHYLPLSRRQPRRRPGLRGAMQRCRLDLLLRYQGRPGGGLPLPERAARSSSSRSASAARNRLASHPGEHDACRRAGSTVRAPYRRAAQHHPAFDRHRAQCRSSCRRRAGSGGRLEDCVRAKTSASVSSRGPSRAVRSSR